MVYGMHRPTLKQFFESELPEELTHAQLLADKITALGGTPTTEPAPIELKSEPTDMLKQVVNAEAETIERYVRRREQAEEAKEYGLATELDDIIRDETEHKEETEKLLRNLRKKR
jgi:bacterioferritin